MKRLWAPWRIKYVQRKNKVCIFCQASKSKQDKKNHIIYRSRFSFAILNIFPYTNGHIMVAPYRHVKDIEDLKDNELLDLWGVLKISQSALNKILRPSGYNIGINIGKVAGAGFAKHLHIHLVPRWVGDVNFMPVIANAKVISQSLKELYDKLIKALRK